MFDTFDIIEVGNGMYQLEYTNYTNPTEKIYTPSCPVNMEKILKLKKKKEKNLQQFILFNQILDDEKKNIN